MRYLSVALVMNLLLIVSLSAYSKDIPIAECIKSTDSVLLKMKISQLEQILALTDRDTCNFSIEVVNKFTTDGFDGVVVGSFESGLNAQEAIFSPKKSNPKFSLVGYLPVASDKISQGYYRFKDQQGGSIFFTDYMVTSQGIVASKDVYELVVNGNYCSIKSKLIATSESGKCLQPIKATFDKPLCFIHNRDSMKKVGNNKCLRRNS